jgi:hypothetical protein
MAWWWLNSTETCSYWIKTEPYKWLFWIFKHNEMNSTKLKEGYPENWNRQFLRNIVPSTITYNVISQKIFTMWLLLWKYVVRIGRGWYWLRVVFSDGTGIRGCEFPRSSTTESNKWTLSGNKNVTFNFNIFCDEIFFKKKVHQRSIWIWILWK